MKLYSVTPTYMTGETTRTRVPLAMMVYDDSRGSLILKYLRAVSEKAVTSRYVSDYYSTGNAARYCPVIRNRLLYSSDPAGTCTFS